VTDAGVCTNAKCARAVSGDPVERYPGPGQFCPDCGELLQPQATEPPPDPARASRPDRGIIAAGAFVVVAALAFLAALAIRGVQWVPALGVRVCTTTMTERVASQLLASYSARYRVWPYHFMVTQSGDLPCDVRFIAGPATASPALFARDGVVVVVNPQNTVARLELDQLRGVFSGRIADWSQLGGRSGPIAAAVPDDNSDEAHELTARLMSGTPIGAHVFRGYTGQQIARWVSSPSGARSIGVLPFSVALPAKVLAVGDSPPPSSLSIADGRYVMSVGMLAVSDFRFPSAPAAALLTFANSPEAGDPINRSALISKNGL
jgi:hypothetical protein